MIDENYKKAFKEVYEILSNTDEKLIKKIPIKFMEFIKNNMDYGYKTNIKLDENIDKQNLLKETEAIISLIYRSYWSTKEEKRDFKEKESIKNKKEYKDIKEIFEKRKNINKISLDNNLMIVYKENIWDKIKNKIRKILNWNK